MGQFQGLGIVAGDNHLVAERGDGEPFPLFVVFLVLLRVNELSLALVRRLRRCRLPRAPLHRRAGLRRLARPAGKRQLDRDSRRDRQLRGFDVVDITVPCEGRLPAAAVARRPRLVVEHGEEAMPRAACVQLERGPDEARPAQIAPRTFKLNAAVLGPVEALDFEDGPRI